MKILHIISYLYPAWSYGGPGKLTYELSNELVQRGHEVTVCTTDAWDARSRRSITDSPFSGTSPRVKIFRNWSNRLAFHQKVFLTPSGYFFVWNHLRDYDVVHTQEVFTPLAGIAALRCRQLGIPFVVSAHGTLSGYHLQHRGMAKRAFFRLFGAALQQADHFIAATEEEVQEYESFGIDQKRIALVPNGIDTTVFERLPQQGNFRRVHRIPETAPLLLYIGRINSLKGLDMLLDAFHHSRLDTGYLVIGGSDDGALPALRETVLRYGLHERVIFPGLLAGEEKLAALSDADLFVYPSPGEGFSLAVLEAGAAGLPLLITEGCKFPDVSRCGAGLIVSGSVKSLGEGMTTMLADRNKLQRMGQAAKRLIARHYSISSMAISLEDVYQSCRIRSYSQPYSL